MIRSISILILVLIYSTPFMGQNISFNAGVGFITYEEAGTPAIANDIEVFLLPSNNFRNSNFAPVFSIFAGAELVLNSKSRLELQLEYYQIISSFVALDISAANLPLKLSSEGIPYLNANVLYSRDLFKLKKFNVGLVLGVTNQTSLKNSFDTFISTQAFEQRTWNILGQVPKSIKRNNILYNYGAYIDYKRFSVSFIRQSYLSESFTSGFEFEGELVRFNASRTLHRLEVKYQFKTLKNKRSSK